MRWTGCAQRPEWTGIIKHLLDRTLPSIIFIWSGKVILGLGFTSPNITLPDQINMILVSVLSNKCIIQPYIFMLVKRLVQLKFCLDKADKPQVMFYFPEIK